MTERAGDLVEFLYERAYARFLELGKDQTAAHTHAVALCSEVQHRFGGDRHYIRAPDTSSRDAEILRAVAQGVPQSVIADRLGVHPNTVSNVIRRHRERQHRRRDSGGFGREDWNL